VQPALLPTVVDLPALSANFPLALQREVFRDNVVNTLKSFVNQGVYAAAVEGPEGVGKTTLLSQFVRRNPLTALSIFVSAANRLSYDADLVRNDVTIQVYFAITGEVLPRATYDPALLKTYYADLQRTARKRSVPFYFVIDGIEELAGPDRDSLLQQLGDIFPIGIPQFRFLFSGDESIYRGLLSSKLVMKSFPVTEFSIEETRAFFGSDALAVEVAGELNGICRGLPGRLAGVPTRE